MPTVSFPLEYLQRLTSLPPAQLAQQAFDYGLEATLHPTSLDVDVTAERPDLLAAEGFVRAFTIYNGQPRPLPDALPASGRRVHIDPAVLPLRPHIAALVVENAQLEGGGLEVLIQFQEKVTQTFGRQRKKIAIGVYDLDQVSGDIHYTARPAADIRFLPLGAKHPLTGQQIVTIHPAGERYRHTLPSLDPLPVLADSTQQVLSLPPIINAAGVGDITASTRNLLIDVTGTLAATVADTANILAHNFIDTGATVKTVEIVTPTDSHLTPSLTPRPVTFSIRYLNEIVGTAIAKHQLGPYLARMDLHATGTDTVLVPTYRTDILSEVDLAGDLLVAVGLENLPPDPTAVKFFTGTANPLRSFGGQVGDLAQRMGLTEVKSYILSDPERLAHFGHPFVTTGNAKSRTLSAPRPTLLAGLLDVLAHNINAPKPINLYELGEVIRPDPSGPDIPGADEGTAVQEALYWGFASLDARASFTTAKAYVQTLLQALEISFELVPCPASHYIAGRAAMVQVGGEVVGEFGEIHPTVLHEFSFPEPVCAGELDCGSLHRARG